jgi:gliding motility-associated-like protein
LDWLFYNPTAGTDSSIATGSNQVDISSFTQDSAQVYSFIYTVSVLSCTVNDTILVNVAALPIVDAGNDTILGYNESYILGGSPTGPVGSSYFWNNLLNFEFEEDEFEPNPSLVVLLSPETYIVTVTDSNGCINRDTVEVKIIPDVVIPSGFSPNDDLKNDTWEIKNLDQFTDIKVSVYNRWGSLLFSTKDPYTYWDGDEIPVGTYYYIIEYDGYEGRVQLTGPITIIR